MSAKKNRVLAMGEAVPLIEAGKHLEAISVLRSYLDRDLDAEILVLWCKLAVLTEEAKIPKDLLVRVAEESKSAAEDLAQLAKVEFENDRIIIAEILVEALVEARPTANYFADLGTIKQVLGDLKAAGAFFQEALKRDPGQGYALLSLTTMALDRGDIGEAMLMTHRIINEGGAKLDRDLLYHLADRVMPLDPNEADRIASCALMADPTEATPKVIELSLADPRKGLNPKTNTNSSGSLFSIGG